MIIPSSMPRRPNEGEYQLALEETTEAIMMMMRHEMIARRHVAIRNLDIQCDTDTTPR